MTYGFENNRSKTNLTSVATSGNYDDLTNKPNLADVATSGDYDDLINKPAQFEPSNMRDVELPILQLTTPYQADSEQWVDAIVQLPVAPDWYPSNTSISWDQRAYFNGYAEHVSSGIGQVAPVCYVVNTSQPKMVAIPFSYEDVTENNISVGDFVHITFTANAVAWHADLPTVAKTGDYDDLVNKPDIRVVEMQVPDSITFTQRQMKTVDIDVSSFIQASEINNLVVLSSAMKVDSEAPSSPEYNMWHFDQDHVKDSDNNILYPYICVRSLNVNDNKAYASIGLYNCGNGTVNQSTVPATMTIRIVFLKV